MQQLLPRFLGTFLLLLATPAHAAIADIGECYMHVENFDQVIEEGDAETTALSSTLEKLVTACEAGDFVTAEAHLQQANAQYNALSAPAPNTTLTDADFWHLADYWWGNRSYRKGVELLRADLSGDGAEDIIGYWHNRDNPDGEYFEILAVSKANGRLVFAYLSLPYDTDTMLSLTRTEQSATHLKTASFDEKTRQSITDIAVSPTALVVDDGMTDQIRLFWPLQANGENLEGMGQQIELIAHRN